MGTRTAKSLRKWGSAIKHKAKVSPAVQLITKEPSLLLFVLVLLASGFAANINTLLPSPFGLVL